MARGGVDVTLHTYLISELGELNALFPARDAKLFLDNCHSDVIYIFEILRVFEK
jgi:hypothetical protein